MPVNLQRLDRKLGAILAKDADEIAGRGAALPFLASGYTAGQLRARLTQFSDLLTQARSASPAQVAGFVATQRAALSAGDVTIANQIRDGLPFDLTQASSSANYLRLCALVLYVFVTDP